MPGTTHPALACRFAVRTGAVITEVRVRGHEAFARAIGAVTAAAAHVAESRRQQVVIEFPDPSRGETVQLSVNESSQISTDQPVFRAVEVARAVRAWTPVLRQEEPRAVRVDHRWLAPGQEEPEPMIQVHPETQAPPERHLRIQR